MELKGKTLLVTGGAAGIGRALAVECLRRGASVALADINLDGAQQSRSLAEATAAPGARCSAHRLDVSRLEDWRAFQAQVLEEHDAVDGIINNAGVTFSGTIEEMSYDQLERVMSINFTGMVYGTKEFLPLLKARPEALIANVSSVFGLFPRAQHGAYCASKYAIRGFTEVLAQELKSTTVQVASIHPGHIGTDIVRNAFAQGNVVGADSAAAGERERLMHDFKAYGLPPEKAAGIILDGLQRHQRKILVGDDAVHGDRLSREDPEGFADASNEAAL